MVFSAVLDDVGDVDRLFGQHVREVRGEPGLHVRDDEAVRETVDMETLERAYAVRPGFGQRFAVAAIDFKA